MSPKFLIYAMEWDWCFLRSVYVYLKYHSSLTMWRRCLTDELLDGALFSWPFDESTGYDPSFSLLPEASPMEQYSSISPRSDRSGMSYLHIYSTWPHFSKRFSPVAISPAPISWIRKPIWIWFRYRVTSRIPINIDAFPRSSSHLAFSWTFFFKILLSNSFMFQSRSNRHKNVPFARFISNSHSQRDWSPPTLPMFDHWLWTTLHQPIHSQSTHGST